MSSKSLKNNLLAFVAVGAFMFAQPNFAQSESLISGFYLQLEGRYVMSDGDETPYAVSSARQIFKIGLNEEDTTARFGMGINIGNRLDVGLHYSGLNIQGNRAGQACGVSAGFPTLCLGPLIGNGAVSTLGAIPYTYAGTGVAQNVEQATYDTTYHVVDFEVGYSLKLGQVDVRAFIGVRYAEFDQTINFAGNYILYQAPVAGLFPVGIHSDLSRNVVAEGIGPRLGVEANVPLGRGFGLAGSVSGSVLFGDRDTVETINFAGFPAGFLFVPGGSSIVNDGDNGDTFWNAEGDLGFTYGVELGNASSMIMTIGYRAEAWFNVNNTQNTFTAPGTFGFPSGHLFGDVNADQLFHGPFMRAKLNF